MLVCVFGEYVNKLRLQDEDTLNYLGESVTGVEIGLRKRWRGLDAFIVFGVLAWMLVDVQMNNINSDAHAQWFSCWKIRADDHDIMKWCHKDLSCYWGRELLKESTTKTSGLSSGFSGTKHLGLLTSHWSSTLAVSVPVMEKSIIRMECVTCLSICMYPTFLGNP